MKRMRLAMCVAVFALIGGIAFAEDMDVRALQARLAAQEARLNDLQAKMNSSRNAGTPEGIVSMRKNAVVTIGGLVNTRYFYRQGKVESKLNTTGVGNAGAEKIDLGTNNTRVDMRKVSDVKQADFKVADAKLAVKIDVNDHFDAYLRMDLHDAENRRNVSGVAQYYWMRWKNICNSGFGVLVGRNNLVFGGTKPAGIIETFSQAEDGTTGTITGGVFNMQNAAAAVAGNGSFGEGMFMWGHLSPSRTIWDQSRTTQITPYWESQDGKWKTELSFMQAVDTRSGQHTTARLKEDGVYYQRPKNYGLGTMSFRLTAQPIEGLKIVASAINQRANNNWVGGGRSWIPDDARTADFLVLPDYMSSANNNFATNIGFQYRPCFFNRLNIWAEWTHGWNENWVKNLDSDTGAFGLVFDINDKLSWFGDVELMRVKNSDAQMFHRANGWATYTGLSYKLGYGVTMEAGWRHEQIKYKDNSGDTHTKYKGDTIYGHLQFAF